VYLLEITESERKYLLSLLWGRRGTVASVVREKLSDAEDCFGVSAWTDADLEEVLQEQDLPVTRQNIRSIRESYVARHLGDIATDHGWEVLEQAAMDLQIAGPNKSPRL
jgi:hypothetical protein